MIIRLIYPFIYLLYKRKQSDRQGVTTHDVRCTKGLNIRLIFLMSGFWIRSKNGCFQTFFKSFNLGPLSTIGLIFRQTQQIFVLYSVEICQIFNLNLVQFLLISVYYTYDIRLISLISGIQIFSRCYPLVTGHRRRIAHLHAQFQRFSLTVSST